MRDNFGYLRASNPVFLCCLQMIRKRIVRDALTDERCDCHQTAVTQTELVSPAPDLSEENVIVEFRTFGSELAELVAPGCLYYFSCALKLIVKIFNF